MTAIYAYGDSYIDKHFSPFYGWIELLAKKMYSPMINRGVSGGSTEYAMLKFINDIPSYDSGDIVIVGLSTPGRLHFQYQNNFNPKTASKYWHEVDKSDSDYLWYNENKEHIKWYIQNFDNNVNAMNHNCYIHSIRNFAETRPDVTVVLVQNRHYYNFIKRPEKKIDNFLMIPIDLYQISSNEFVDPHTYNDWIVKTKYDARVNHLSIPNLNRMVDLMIESFETKRTDNFTYDKFLQNIFTPIVTRDDYFRYVNDGLIYDRTIEPEFNL